MALASDLMGLGENPLFAARTATGGTGPISVTSAGSNAATATKIAGAQYVTFITGASAAGVILPAAGGDLGPLIADDYILHNGNTSNTVLVYAPSGVTINIGGAAYTNAAPFTIAGLKTVTIYTAPTTTQWFGLSA